MLDWALRLTCLRPPPKYLDVRLWPKSCSRKSKCVPCTGAGLKAGSNERASGSRSSDVVERPVPVNTGIEEEETGEEEAELSGDDGGEVKPAESTADSEGEGG